MSGIDPLQYTARAMRVLALIAVVCPVVWAAPTAQVLQVGKDQKNIAVSHDGTKPWIVGDTACVGPQGATSICGRVVRATGKGAIVRLDAASTSVAAGDPVRRGQERRKPAALLLNSVEKTEGVGNYLFNLSAGMTVSLSAFFPMLSLQASLSPHLAVGIIPMYVRASSTNAGIVSSISSFGGIATLNYYHDGYFRGLWGQLGSGLLFLSASDGLIDESATSLAFLGTVGWRGYWDLGLNIGVAAGALYLQDPAFVNTQLKSVGILPTIVVDVGINF